jgi:hypothetical protein
MSGGRLNLVKLCVGAEGVEDLIGWVEARAEERRRAGLSYTSRHVTRMWPRRAEEILGGGSLYWVFKGWVLARQTIEDFEPVDLGDGIRRCGIVMRPEVVLTEARPRRPFQGWRYLTEKDASPDLAAGADAAAEMPAELRRALGDLGVI